MKRTSMCCLVVLALFAMAGNAQRLQLADRARIVNVSDPQLSPDARQLLCVVSRVNVAENRHDGQLALIDVASGA